MPRAVTHGSRARRFGWRLSGARLTIENEAGRWSFSTSLSPSILEGE